MIRHHKADEEGSEIPASGNLIPPILGLIGVGLLAWGGWALGLIDNPSGDGFAHCAAIQDDHARLACYDKLSAPRQPAKGAVAPFRAPSPWESQ
jgi:hypothetical protein